jgi:hypothetical protein
MSAFSSIPPFMRLLLAHYYSFIPASLSNLGPHRANGHDYSHRRHLDHRLIVFQPPAALIQSNPLMPE